MTALTEVQSISTKGQSFEPKIVGFLCNWCSYAGADKAGATQTPYPPNVAVVRVMCSGRVDAQFVLDAFQKGADGVLILACHSGDCHYKEGNYRAVLGWDGRWLRRRGVAIAETFPRNFK